MTIAIIIQTILKDRIRLNGKDFQLYANILTSIILADFVINVICREIGNVECHSNNNKSFNQYNTIIVYIFFAQCLQSFSVISYAN